MIVHKILRGPQAALYLPFALSRLRSLEATQGNDTYWTQRFVIGDYAIKVQQTPPFQYVTITQGGGVSYEFFTSEHVSDTSFGSPGFQDGLTNSFVCGSALRVRFRGSSATPKGLYSTEIVPGAQDGWKTRACNALQGQDTGLYTWRAWQNQKFFEHAWHPNNDGKSLVTSCQAQAPGLAGQCNWMSPYNFCRLASAGSKVSDFGLDVLPTLYNKAGTITGAPALEQGWLNWRHAAVQNAGGRQFFISTDNYGRFQIYPVKDYSASANVVPIGQYKVFTPPYPAWVSAPDPSDYTRQVNDWLWRFNKDATKCVSVPYHSDFSSGFSKTLAGEQFFATLTAARVALVDPAYLNAVVPAHEDTPGLVEFGIAIEVTGPGDMDFNVTFTLLRTSYFNDSGRFFFDAAYFMKDVEHLATDPAFVAEDTLVTAEVRCLYPAGYYTADSGESPPHYLDLAANVSGSIVVNTNDAAMVPTLKFAFPTFNGGHAKFATVDGYGGGFGPGPIGGYVNYAVGGSVYTGSAGPVTYVPPDPPFTIGTYGVQLGLLYALELSTLSALYEVDDQVAGTGFVSLVSYGAEIYRDSYSLGYSHPAAPWPAADTVMPSARWHQYLLDSTLNTEWGMGFNVHPLGHWSFSVNAELGKNPTLAAALDWISVKNKDNTRTRYTHKDLFDKAFKQTRDYPYYTEPFSGKTDWDQGSFRTAGFWVTFR